MTDLDLSLYSVVRDKEGVPFARLREGGAWVWRASHIFGIAYLPSVAFRPILKLEGVGAVALATWWHAARHPECMQRIAERSGMSVAHIRRAAHIPSWFPVCTKEHKLFELPSYSLSNEALSGVGQVAFALMAPKHPSVTPYRCKCGKWHHQTRRFANRKGKRR